MRFVTALAVASLSFLAQGVSLANESTSFHDIGYDPDTALDLAYAELEGTV